MVNKFKMPPTGATSVPKTASELAAAEDQFYSGATTIVKVDPADKVYPWEGLRSDKDTELFNLRLTEEEKSKLDYIAANTPQSRAKFAKEAFLVGLNAKIKELTGR